MWMAMMQLVAQALSCKLEEFPIQYLGVSLHHSKLKREDIQSVVDKILKRAADWREKLLNHAAKLELVRSVLDSIPLYLLSIIKFPKWEITLITLRWLIVSRIIMRDIINTI
jgi:hypothetical protein